MQEVKTDEVKKTKRSTGLKAYLVLLAVPTIAFVFAILVSILVPGCRCDEGAGCAGCGLNGLVAFCMFGGFVGALCMLMFGWPIIFVVNLFAGD